MTDYDKHAAILEWAERVREASEEATPGPWGWDYTAMNAAAIQSGGERVVEAVAERGRICARDGEGMEHVRNLDLIASTASPDIAAAVRDVVVLSMEHMATLDDYRGGLDDEDPEYVGASYEAVLDAEYRYKEALDRLAEVLRERESTD